MKETIHKSLILSLLITNIWSVIIFFIYFFEAPGLFSGWTTLVFFLYSCWVSAALGILTISISFLKKWLSLQLKIFLIAVTAWFNSFFSILLLIVTLFEIIRSEAIFGLYLFSNLIISILSVIIIRKILKKQ